MGEARSSRLRAVLGLAAVAGAAAACSKSAAEPPNARSTGAATVGSGGSASAGGARATSSALLAREAPPFDFQLGPLPGFIAFEGTVKVQVITDPKTRGPEVTTYAFRDKRVRWNLFAPKGSPGEDSYRIYDGELHRFFTVVPAKQTAFFTDESTLQARAGAPRSDKLAPDMRNPKGVVHLYHCDRMLLQDGQTQYDMCLSKEVGALPLHLLAQDIATLVPFGKSLEDQGLFPLDLTARREGPDHAVQVTGSLTVLEMNRGSVPDIAYGVPHNFTHATSSTLDLDELVR